MFCYDNIVCQKVVVTQYLVVLPVRRADSLLAAEASHTFLKI